MSIHIHRSADTGWTKLPNAILRDPALTLRARGLLVQLLSHEDGWQLSLRYSTTQCADGRQAVASAFTELEAAGYATRKRAKDSSGRFRGWDYDVYDHPVSAPADVSGNTVIGDTVIGDTVIGEAHTLVEALEVEPQEEETQDERQELALARSRDELFEALYLVQTGEKYEAGTKVSPRERDKINKARSELKAGGYTGADVLAAIPGWPIAMGDLNITALGLSGNMRRCLNAAAGASFRQEQQRETVEDRALKLVQEHMAEEERRAIEIGEVLA